jgi:hypothetical protein
MLLHPKMQRLRTALREPAIICTGYSPDGVLEESESLRESGMGGGKDEGTHDDI